MATQATRYDQRIFKDEETGKWMIVTHNGKVVPYPIGDQNEQAIGGKDINQMFPYKFPDMPFLNIGKDKNKTTLGEGSICRYVSKEGVVTFKRGLTKGACMNFSKDALFTEEPWEPHTMPSGDTRGMALPWGEGKDLTLDLEKRKAYQNSIWAQMGEEGLLRDRANFGFSADSTGYLPGGGVDGGDLQGMMTVPPQAEGYDYSPGTQRYQEMLASTIAPTQRGFQDQDPSFADYVSEMEPNRAGGSGFQPVPYYQHPAKPTYNVGGTVHEGGALDYSPNIFTSKEAFERKLLAAVGPNWKEVMTEEDMDYYNSLPTEFTAGATYRGSDEYAEKRGERAQYLNRQNLWNRMEEERGPDIGLANYVPPVNLEQREADQNLFDEAKRKSKFNDWYKAKEMAVLGRENYGEEDAAFDAAGYPNFIMGDDGTFPGKAVQPTKDDFRLTENDGTLGSELVMAEDQDEAEQKTDKIQVGPRWYEAINDPDNPNSIRSQIYNTIIDTGMDKMFDSIDDNSPQWLQKWAAGIKTDIENRDWLKAGAKLWVTRVGGKYALKTLWKLIPFTNGKFLTAGNVIKIGVGAEVYEMSVNSDEPIMTQIQNKIEEIMGGGPGGGPEIIEEDGKGTEDVTVTEDVTTKITPIDAVNEPSLWNQLTTSNASGTTGDTGLLNTGTGTAQQQGYSGNIGDMFSNLWNPNPETMDYWYKTREGDIPGNNRMREAMARLAYMGLYPEDRGTDPYQALTDDRVSYTNNLLDAASSQATLSATAANRQYTQWKNMLPSQNELAKQLVKQKGWTDFFTSQDDLDQQAQQMAGSLLRQFHGLMAKGIAPTPDNLKVANFLEKNGIDATAESVNYALQNGVLEAMQGDDDGGNTQTAVGAVQSMKSMISNAASAFTQ